MSAVYSIKCDRCGNITKDTSDRSLRECRSYNRLYGWTWKGAGRDYCRECSLALADAAKKEPFNGYY